MAHCCGGLGPFSWVPLPGPERLNTVGHFRVGVLISPDPLPTHQMGLVSLGLAGTARSRQEINSLGSCECSSYSFLRSGQGLTEKGNNTKGGSSFGKGVKVKSG